MRWTWEKKSQTVSDNSKEMRQMKNMFGVIVTVALVSWDPLILPWFVTRYIDDQIYRGPDVRNATANSCLHMMSSSCIHMRQNKAGEFAKCWNSSLHCRLQVFWLWCINSVFHSVLVFWMTVAALHQGELITFLLELIKSWFHWIWWTLYCFHK